MESTRRHAAPSMATRLSRSLHDGISCVLGQVCSSFVPSHSPNAVDQPRCCLGYSKLQVQRPSYRTCKPAAQEGPLLNQDSRVRRRPRLTCCRPSDHTLHQETPSTRRHLAAGVATINGPGLASLQDVDAGSCARS